MEGSGHCSRNCGEVPVPSWTHSVKVDPELSGGRSHLPCLYLYLPVTRLAGVPLAKMRRLELSMEKTMEEYEHFRDTKQKKREEGDIRGEHSLVYL